MHRNDLDIPVQYLKGVGPARAELFDKINIHTVRDLITYFPFRHEDRSNLRFISMIEDGEETTVSGTVKEHKWIPTRKSKGILKIVLEDGTGEVIMVCFNQGYLKDTIPTGTRIFLHGRFQKTFNCIETSNFTYEKIKENEDMLIHTGRIVPIYQVTANLGLRFFRALIKKTLDETCGELKDALPADLREKYSLMGYRDAIKNIHFPPDNKRLQEAYRRLVFEEFFFLETAMALKKINVKGRTKKRRYSLRRNLLTPFKQALPFTFTDAQKRVIREIFGDLSSSVPMNRLLQGDVGSGKTVVATSAILFVIENGYQCVLMAPTDVLAKQHFVNISRMTHGLDVKIELISGKMQKKGRYDIYQKLKEKKIDLVIGTHAILEDQVEFRSLGLAIIDEQHKFGVTQRARLRKKGEDIDVLIMTATPIPRTLAMTVYGDLDTSVIDELPSGRTDIITRHVDEDEAYNEARKHIASGEQVYVIYPLVKESEKLELKAATKMFNHLKKVFKGSKIDILHGQQPPGQQEKVMKDFLTGNTDILVATTVIEVGIDVPDATVMIIEDFDRFGLATLHQLRGRVGRGSRQSYCFLTGSAKSKDAGERLRVMLETTDGFKIAEEDLSIRGLGEFFGTKQHGLPELSIGDLLKDRDILFTARHAAFGLIDDDPFLMKEKNVSFRTQLYKRYKKNWLLGSVG